MTRGTAVAVMISVLVAAHPRAQAPAPSATITGRVIADDTGDPIHNARVIIPTEDFGGPVTLTDSDGRFTLPTPATSFRVAASKSGYERREVTIPVATRSIEIRLRRGGVISGRVTDEFGEPVIGVRVMAGTRAEPSAARLQNMTNVFTDDRGEYRLAGLMGRIVVGVETIGIGLRGIPLPGGGVGYSPPLEVTYYPDTTVLSEATELELQPGREMSGLDFLIPSIRSASQPFSVVRGMPIRPPFMQQPTSQVAQRKPGIIRGRVVDSEGRNLSNALVLVMTRRGAQLESRLARADRDGRFEFLDVTPGAATLVASKQGYSGEPAANPLQAFASLPTTPVDVAEGETRVGIEIKMSRWSTLTGRVLDEYGEPVAGATVQLMQVRYESGRRRLVPSANVSQRTNDLGVYRLYGITPGQYIVSASVSEVTTADLPGYARSFFPQTAIPAEAQFISIARSQDSAGVDIVLARSRTARITGKILSASGEPTMGGSVMLMPSVRSSSVTNVPAGARLRNDGSFEFPNVVPGQYVIKAYQGRNGSKEGEFGMLPVTISDRDVTGLVLQMSSGSTIAGRISFDNPDRSKWPPAGGIELSPIPVDPDAAPENIASAEIQPDWTFSLLGINGPRRLQLVQAPPGWALRAVRVNGIDVTDRAIPFGQPNQSLMSVDVVLTDRVSELSGTLSDQNGTPVASASLLVFSTNRDQWYPASRYLRRAIASADGTFTLAGLPTGSYYAVAVGRIPAEGPDAWQDPAFLTSMLARATSVTIAEGDKRAINLRLAN